MTLLVWKAELDAGEGYESEIRDKEAMKNAGQ
jgi:hypothetical protein